MATQGSQPHHIYLSPSHPKSSMLMESSAPASPSRRQALLHKVVELLREYPTFDIPTPGESVAVLSPEEREGAWVEENLHLLRRRMKTVALVVMLFVPPLWVFYTLSSPADARTAISLTESLVLLICTALIWGARRVTSIRMARLLTMCVYMALGLCASAIMVEAKDPRVMAFSGHAQIIVSLLFIPFTVVEASFCTSIVIFAFSLGLYYALPPEQYNLIFPRTLSVAFSGTLMVAMVYIQGMVRRRAFDSAFDMAVSASQAAALSNADFLTGAANRRHFEATAGIELARSTRTKRPLSLLMFDLDGFKAVNDTCGHSAGDDVLRAVFRAAQNTVRGSDILARWGGDEFVLALPETNCDDAKYTATRLGEAVAHRLEDLWGKDSIQAKVTLSIGITSITDGEPSTLLELIDRADAALYRAKRKGKNCILVA
ncbi:GGDEF domain-containing protein [bacterium]|nr:MAG: GGDEF domain-containing protein [bacterium]